MTDTQLKCFLAAAKYENFTKAAETLFLSQPVVGRHISNLETEMGITLFIRDRKAVRLTENGKIFADFVSEMFDKYAEMNKQLHSNVRENTMNLIIGTTDGQAIGNTLAAAFQYIDGNVSNLHVTISNYINSKLISALKEGQIDVALMDFDDVKDNIDILDFKVVRHVKSYLVVPASHKNASKKTHDRYDFKDQKFIVLSDNDSEYVTDLQKRAAEWLGIENIIVASDITTLVTLAEAGLGVTTIPDNHKLFSNPNVKAIDFPEICYHSLEVVTWPKNRYTPPIVAFCDILDKSGYLAFSDDYKDYKENNRKNG